MERLKDGKYMCVYVHAMDYYSAIKKNEIHILTFVVWMDLENIMLSEISLTEKDKCYMISLICEIQKIQQTSGCNKKAADSLT